MINELLGMQQAASEHAAGVDHMLELLHWFVLVLFVPWSAFFIYTIVRFRKSRHPKADYGGVRGHGYKVSEVAVCIIEAVLLLGFAIPLWANRVNQFPPQKDSIVVRVIGEQFAWNVHYPGPDGKLGRADAGLVTSDNPLGLDKNDPNGQDDIVALNQLHLPVNRDVIVYVTSKDVIHSFKLLQMRVCQDAIPGMSVPTWFKPTKTSAQTREGMTHDYPCQVGVVPKDFVAMQDYPAANVKKLDDLNKETIEKLSKAGIAQVKAAPANPYEIVCAQLCGLNHYRMRGVLTVHTAEEYDQWVATQAAKPKTGGGESLE